MRTTRQVEAPAGPVVPTVDNYLAAWSTAAIEQFAWDCLASLKFGVESGSHSVAEVLRPTELEIERALEFPRYLQVAQLAFAERY